jgi:hypothetical protein
MAIAWITAKKNKMATALGNMFQTYNFTSI